MHFEIRGGPKELGAAGFYSFKTTAGVIRVQHFLENWRTLTEDIDKILCITMSWTQYSAGVPYPILSKTSPELSYVKERTILATRKFLNECNVVIHLDKTYVQHPKQMNDVSIMNLVNTQTMRIVKMNKKKGQLCSNISRGKLCK